MPAFAFLGGSFEARSPSFDSSRTINLYPELSESGSSRSPIALIGTPGLVTWLELDGGGIRGCIAFTEDTAIVVSGPNVYRVRSDKSYSLIGSVSVNNAVISMASNGTIIMLVDGPTGYFINPSSGVTQIVNEAFEGGDKVDFVDGYFIWNKPNTGQFQTTLLYSDQIDGLDFATAEGSPDNIRSLIVDHREVWLLGTDSGEVFFNSGNVDFAFERIQGAFLEVGCAAAHSVAKMDNSIFWLATDARGFGTIQRASGYSAQRLSNHAVEFAIAEYRRQGTIADAVAYTYAQEGHSFYVISFPSAHATWCYDASTNLWHQRAYRNPSTGALERHRSNCHMAFAGLAIVGDWELGKLYSLDLDTFTDDGQPLPAIRACPHIASDGQNSFHHQLELFMQTGVGLSDGQGADPQARLRWSDDGGYTWSSESWAPIGKIGERRARVRWQRLGRSRDRVYEVTVTDPVRRVFTSANLVVSNGLT